MAEKAKTTKQQTPQEAAADAGFAGIIEQDLGVRLLHGFHGSVQDAYTGAAQVANRIGTKIAKYKLSFHTDGIAISMWPVVQRSKKGKA